MTALSPLILGRLCFSQNRRNDLSFCFYAIPDAKPLRNFSGIALEHFAAGSDRKIYQNKVPGRSLPFLDDGIRQGTRSPYLRSGRQTQGAPCASAGSGAKAAGGAVGI
jgi:hypothetical protein